MNQLPRFHSAVCGLAGAVCGLVLAPTAPAGPRSSANYAVLTDTLDAGGRASAAGTYAHVGSLGGLAGVSAVASPAGAVKAGFIGQLTEVAGLIVSMHFPFRISCRRWSLVGSVLLACQFAALADDLAPRCADRAAVERIYHEHRTGTKPAFAKAMPAALLEKLVRDDAKKEAVLERVYGVRITGPMVEAEVQRIHATTRAPEMLTEIKAALGNDAAKFAEVFAKPIVVDRTLRARFENDDTVHAPQRRLAESARLRVLAEKAANDWPEMKWKLTARPADDAPAPPAATGPTTVTNSGGLYRNEATAQIAQVLSPPPQSLAEKDHYFADLPAELQNVLRVQLRQPGDVSAIIETSSAFQCYLARERTAEILAVAVLTVPKRTCAEWLAEQPQP